MVHSMGSRGPTEGVQSGLGIGGGSNLLDSKSRLLVKSLTSLKTTAYLGWGYQVETMLGTEENVSCPKWTQLKEALHRYEPICRSGEASFGVALQGLGPSFKFGQS